MRKASQAMIMSGLLGLSCTVQAGVVFQDNFDGELNGAVPNSGVDWFVFNPTGSTAAIDGAIGNPASSIGIVDTNTNAARTSLNFGVPAVIPFNMINTGQEVFKITFDLRVDAFANSSPGNGSTPRVGLKDGTTDRNFILGIARNNLADGDGDQDVFFYAGDSGTGSNNFFGTPIGSSQALGFTGSGWVPGFDLGTYDASVSTNNGTRTAGGSPEWYRFALTFVKESTSVDVTATRLSTGQTTSNTMTTGAAFSFSSTGTDIITFFAAGSGTGTAYLDNIVIESSAIPEPMSLIPVTLGSLALLRRSRQP